VDVIATHLVGAALARNREVVTETMRDWSVDQDLWVRRTAVLSQLAHKANTDRDLLRAVIENNLADTSFWLRKAIGWSLREFARTDPDWVIRQVTEWGDALSGLSRREALKHLGSRADLRLSR
jgi:3-methyladenine DNA glycosylase AlkD